MRSFGTDRQEASAVDALIAATAIVHKMKLVTRNVDDMAGMGVPIFNPFDEN